MTRRKRPSGMTVEEAFQWFMPGHPPEAPSPTEGCWDWSGPMGKLYGELTVDRQFHRAHRVSYGIFVGDIPEGLLLRHTCDRHVCVQPAHLIPGTIKENAGDMKSRLTGNHRGEGHERAKLTESDVRQIRSQAGKVTQLAMARELNVDPSVISNIVRKKTWTHIE